MRKKSLTIAGFLILSLALSLLFWSCSAASSRITASLGEEFTLPLGKTAAIENENLTLKFEAVLTDSRCPEGVECVWAGEAQCRMLFTLAGSPAEMIIVQPGGGAPATDVFIYYKIKFKLEPYPQEGQQIDPSEYRLIMTITK